MQWSELSSVYGIVELDRNSKQNGVYCRRDFLKKEMADFNLPLHTQEVLRMRTINVLLEFLNRNR